MEETAILSQESLMVSPSPHAKHPDTVRTVMYDVCIALLPALLWAFYLYGMWPIVLTLVAVGSCMLFEYGYQKLLKRPITVLDGSAAVSGMLLAFNLPPEAPIWLPIVGSAFAILLVKQLFGGIGKNVVNPALAARLFLCLSFPAQMTDFSVDGVATATPLAHLFSDRQIPTNLLKHSFFGNVSGCIGEVSTAMLLVGGVYLLLRKVITWHIPTAYLGTVFVLALIFPQNASVPATTYALLQLCAGGLMLGALFMATDYATSPVTPRGRLLFGVGCGLFTVLIRYFGSGGDCVSYAILTMNLLVPGIDRITRPRRFGGGKDAKK